MSDAKPERLTLGIDLGTSAVKVVALGVDDAVMAEGAAGFGTHSTLPQQAEQQTADWLRAASRAMHALANSLKGSLGSEWATRVAAIGLTGQLPTLVCLDDAKPLFLQDGEQIAKPDLVKGERIRSPRLDEGGIADCLRQLFLGVERDAK